MSPEELEAHKAAIKRQDTARNKFSGRKPTGANKQFAKSGGIRPSRAKDPSIGEIKQLFLHGTLDAVKEVRKIMTHSRSEALRLAASTLWLDRALGTDDDRGDRRCPCLAHRDYRRSGA
jgi:hypothetical protein